MSRRARGEELVALATAKQIIKQAVAQTDADVSFLQVSKLSTIADLTNFEVMRMVWIINNEIINNQQQ